MKVEVNENGLDFYQHKQQFWFSVVFTFLSTHCIFKL